MNFAKVNPASTTSNLVLILDGQNVVADPTSLVKMIAHISGGKMYP